MPERVILRGVNVVRAIRRLYIKESGQSGALWHGDVAAGVGHRPHLDWWLEICQLRGGRYCSVITAEIKYERGLK